MPTHWTSPFFLFPVAYLAGSINFSILLFKLMGKSDPRTGFSGNPGATNVYRQAGLPWAIVVLLLDGGRAVAVAFGAIYFLQDIYFSWSGFFLILGNRFPCFHSFRGGKGVANFLGFSAVLSPWAALVSGCTWIAVNVITKKPFIASFGMVTVLSIGTVLKFPGNYLAIIGTMLTALLIIVSHKKNVMEYFDNLKQKSST